MGSRSRTARELYRALVSAAARGAAAWGSAAGAACTRAPPPRDARAASLLLRGHAAGYATAAGSGASGGGKPPRIDLRTMVAAYVESTMGALSIPAGELQPLLARPSTSESDVLAWAAAKLAAHPAAAAAAPHLERVSRLRRALGAAAAGWPAPASPLELLLARSGQQAAAVRLSSLSRAQLEGTPEYALAMAALERRSGPGASDVEAKAALRDAAQQLLAAPPLDALRHAGFWRSLQPALESAAGLQAELLAAGADTAAVLAARNTSDELLTSLLGKHAAGGAARLAGAAPLGGGGGAEAEWLRAVAGAPPDAYLGCGGAFFAAAYRVTQWAAAQLGLSASAGCAGAGAGGSLVAGPPAWDVARRMALAVPPPPALPASLSAAFEAAAPALLAAAAKLPVAELAEGRVDVWALMEGGGAAEKALASELRAWRAAQAAAGSVPALATLTRAEVGALSAEQFAAVRGHAARLAAGAGPALAGALAAAAAGRAPLAPAALAAIGRAAVGGPQGQQQLQAAAGGGGEDGAAADDAARWAGLDLLAWALHTRAGGAGADGRLLSAALSGARAAYVSEAAAAVEASEVCDDLRTAFRLEAEVARVDSVVRPDRLLSGEVDAQLDALLPPTTPLRPLQRTLLANAGEPSAAAAYGGGGDGEQQQQQGGGGGNGNGNGNGGGGGARQGSLLAALSSFLGQAAAAAEAGAGGAASGAAPGAAARGLLRSWSDAAAALAAAPRLVPPALDGRFGDLLALGTDADGPALEALGPAEAEARVARLQAQLVGFLAAWDEEMAAEGAAGEGGGGDVVTTAPDGVRRPGWPAAGGGAAGLPGGKTGLRTLADLVGEEEALAILAARSGPGAGPAAAAAARDDAGGEGRLGEGRGGGGGIQPYELVERVQHDIHVQRYLASEFDPSLAADLRHAPLGWRDPRLSVAPGAWLEGMRPLLDAYLEAQGEQPTHDIEWRVYSEMALAEAGDDQATHEAGLRARGRSAFHSSAADAAFLRSRLEAAVPQGSVLAAAARRYLDAALRNPSWTFGQRRRLVDRLGELAADLAKHPPRSARGSPFSALLQPGGPPLAPRLSRPPKGRRARRGEALGVGVVEPTAPQGGAGKAALAGGAR